MKKTLLTAAVAGMLAIAPVAFGSGAGDARHYAGEASATLDAAIANLVEYNRQLAEILGGEINDHAMQDIHRLSYTLENALDKVNDELLMLRHTLSDMHVASEDMDPDAVADYGAAYLSVADKLFK